MASIADSELRAYAQKNILRSINQDYKILTVKPILSQLYKQWYNKKIREFL